MWLGYKSQRQRPSSILKRDAGEARGFAIDFVRILCIVGCIKGRWAWTTGPSKSELLGITTPSEVRLGYKYQGSPSLIESRCVASR